MKNKFCSIKLVVPIKKTKTQPKIYAGILIFSNAISLKTKKPQITWKAAGERRWYINIYIYMYVYIGGAMVGTIFLCLKLYSVLAWILKRSNVWGTNISISWKYKMMIYSL